MSTDHAINSVRNEFSKLDLDGKTSFLVEAIFSTAGSAITEIGSRLNGLVALVTQAFEDTGSDPDAAAPAEAEPKEEAEARAETGAEAQVEDEDEKGVTDSATPRSRMGGKKAGSKKT